ncbi:hypothetical protein BJ138DRAFT_1119166 [Hygrophoropsis aurantiaca]|uniref:Uncharacterized protein n=1 Tax=Hygrophoropsis aurantiaca TaxID=72124 RepID=A0ACB7ZU60_9AGAM|nr:hypothetical protein BJ138DRAFT_1119166 [Hygrophoropsis aurantiaca]
MDDFIPLLDYTPAQPVLEQHRLALQRTTSFQPYPSFPVRKSLHRDSQLWAIGSRYSSRLYVAAHGLKAHGFEPSLPSPTHLSPVVLDSTSSSKMKTNLRPLNPTVLSNESHVDFENFGSLMPGGLDWTDDEPMLSTCPSPADISGRRPPTVDSVDEPLMMPGALVLDPPPVIYVIDAGTGEVLESLRHSFAQSEILDYSSMHSTN